jgi:methyltransferase
MQIAYPASFAVMFLEAFFRGTEPPGVLVVAGALIFTVAKALKWWAILALGRFWTFRVIVVPGTTLVRRGPYRFLRHPNYVGVVGELVGVGLLTGAFRSAPVATAVFGALIVKRVAVEERALRKNQVASS